ncbi:MAG: glycosyltransferase family 2 protein [bacterium]
MNKKKVAIFIIAYQAVNTLINAIERIPDRIKKDCEEIFVFDDCSDDNTYYAGLGFKAESGMRNLNIYKNPKNLGYGGNQKNGYNYAIEKEYDIVVMLHGDVQYAPEEIPNLIEPLFKEEADAVFGSRFMNNPLKQGMPVWRYIGNRILTWAENRVLGLNLSEFHSGFRAYSVSSLKKIPFNLAADDYNFDTDIVIQLKLKGLRIKEIPIPTHYGPESHQIPFSKSFKYGLNIFKSLFQYILTKKGMVKIKKFDVSQSDC